MDETKKQLVELLKWATGSNRSGNPYGYEPVVNALKHLSALDGGWNTEYGYLDALDAYNLPKDEMTDGQGYVFVGRMDKETVILQDREGSFEVYGASPGFDRFSVEIDGIDHEFVRQADYSDFMRAELITLARSVFP